MMTGGFDSIGKILMVIGAILFFFGILVHFGAKFSALGRLPGDIHIERENFSFSFPVMTSILISILLTVVLNLLFRR